MWICIRVSVFRRYVSPLHGTTAPSVPGPSQYRDFTITLRHTTLGRTSLDEWSTNVETSTWQHITLTRDRHPRPQWDSNPQSQKASATHPSLRRRSHWDRLGATCRESNHTFQLKTSHHTDWNIPPSCLLLELKDTNYWQHTKLFSDTVGGEVNTALCCID